MKYLLDKNSLPILQSLTFSKTLFAFDFDGTLAPIVSGPDNAFMTKRTLALLRKLSSCAQVGILSGRSRDDLKKRIPFRNIMLIGNHGVEGLNSKKNTLTAASDISRNWKSVFANYLSSTDNVKGIVIEDKTYSLALHYRHSRNKLVTRKKLLNIVAGLAHQPRIIMGKSVINLLPSGAPHKGIALLEMMLETQCQAALYIGDDDTDEDVFSLPDDRVIGVRVGKKKKSSATFYLERQKEINIVLEHICKHFGEA